MSPRRLSIAAAAALVLASISAAGSEDLPAGFVYLRDVDPTIAQDIRYAGFDNFVGRPLPGYEAAECILRRAAAAALKRVQSDLAASGVALKVYDCYRPARAVRAMGQWADGPESGGTRRFYPQLSKNNLFALGYIAARSAHSTGIAVDLTLIATSRPAGAAFDAAARYGPCTGPAALRAPDTGIDMGTGYDCFDAASHTASAAVGGEQKRARTLLAGVMAKHGFHNYHREWWHFAYGGETPASHYDFPIRARAAQTPR